VLGFTLFMGVWSVRLAEVYPFLFVYAAIIAMIVGFSNSAPSGNVRKSSGETTRTIPRLIYSPRMWVLVSVTVVLGTGLAAAVIL
jgi:hypothetical protein